MVYGEGRQPFTLVVRECLEVTSDSRSWQWWQMVHGEGCLPFMIVVTGPATYSGVGDGDLSFRVVLMKGEWFKVQGSRFKVTDACRL